MARNKRATKSERVCGDLEFFSVWAENLGISIPGKKFSNLWGLSFESVS